MLIVQMLGIFKYKKSGRWTVSLLTCWEQKQE